MKTKTIKTLYILVTLAVIAIFTEGFIKYKKSGYFPIFPVDVQDAGNIVNSGTFDTWINFVNPAVDVFVLPADSPNFVGDNPTSGHPAGQANNNDFHRWAEQMFLWLLSPAPQDGSYGSCGGLVLNSQEFYDYDLMNYVYKKHVCTVDLSFNKNKNISNVGNSMTFGVKGTNKGSKNLPILIEAETNKVFDVDKTPTSENNNPLIYDGNKNKIEVGSIKADDGKPVFYDLKGNIINNPSLILSEGLDKNSTVQQFSINNQIFTIAFAVVGDLDAVVLITPMQNQAQSSNVLMARNRSLVYYNIMVNDIAAVFSTMVNKGVANGGLPNTAKFPTTVAELNTIKVYAANNNIPLVNTNDRVLAMEVKTSWVETINFTSTPPSPTAVNPPPYIGDYVTIKAYIPNYTQITSTSTWTLDTSNPTRLATLALVGVHVVGSVKGHPEMIWSTFEHVNNTPNTNFEYKDGLGNIISPGNDINSKNWLFCDPSISSSTPVSSFNISNIYQNGNYISNTTGHTINPSNTLRIKPFGWAGPANNNSPGVIEDEEISRQGTHTARLIALKNDVDGNLLAGDVRKNYYQVGATWNSKIKINNIHVGSIILSNSTMETYTQTAKSCFGCHDSEPGPNRDMPYITFLSHVVPVAHPLIP